MAVKWIGTKSRTPDGEADLMLVLLSQRRGNDSGRCRLMTPAAKSVFKRNNETLRGLLGCLGLKHGGAQ